MPKTSHAKNKKESSTPLKKKPASLSADLIAANRKLKRESADRKRADEQLRLLSKAIEQSQSTVVITDPNGNIKYVNPKFVQLTGYSVEEALGQNPRLVKSGETSPEEYKRLWATITAGQAWHGLFHNRKKNGELYWEETNISPVFDANEKITHFVAVKEDITERKRAEEALQQRTHELGERVKELNCLYGLSNLVETNGESLELLMLRVAELLPSAWQYPSITCVRIALDGQAFSTANFEQTAWRQQRPIRVRGAQVGSVEVCYLEARPDSDEGPFLRQEGWLLEIVAERLGRATERIQTRQTLRKREEHLSLATMASGQGMWDWDIVRDEAYLSPRYYELTGYTEGEIHPYSVFFGNLIHPDDYPTVAKSMARHLQGQSEYSIIEYRMRRKSGEYTWMRSVGKVVAHDEKGAAIRMAGVIHDITERKQIEQALQESQERIRAILDTAVNGIIVINEQGIVESINRAARSIFGYAENEVIGQSINMLMPEPYRTEHDGYIANYLRTGTKKIIGIGREVTALRKNGTTFPMSLAVSEVLVGGLHLFTGIVVDITERKHAEEMVQRQTQLLSALYEIMLDVLQYRELDKLLQVIVDRSTHLLDAPYSEIMLLEGNELVVRAFTANQSFLAGDRATESEASLSWRAVRTRQPTGVEDYAIWQQRRQIHSDQHLHAVVDFPILSGDRCVGVLAVGRDRAGYVFDREQLQAGSLVAQLAALAIDNVQSYTSALVELDERRRIEVILEQDKEKFRELMESAQRHAQELALLGEVRTGLAREIELADLFHVAVEAVAKILGYTQVSLYLLRGDVLQLQHEVGYDHVISEIPIMQGVMARSVRTGSVIFLPDVRTDPDFLGAIEGVASEICVPLIDQRTAVGALNVESIAGNVLTQADVGVISALGEHISIAIGRARLYTELRQSERRYKDLVEIANDIIYKIAVTGHFTFVNPTSLRIMGYTEAELIGKHYLTLIRSDYRRPAAHFYEHQFQSRTPQTYFEFPAITKDGTVVWVGQNVQLILNAAGDQIVEAQAIARDITDLHQAEEVLHQHVQELSERNAELDAFGHTVAHDLRDLISVIISYSELLIYEQSTISPQEAEQALRVIDRTGHKVNRVINELMVLSGVRQQEVSLGPIEMSQIIDEALQRLGDAIQQASAEISLPDRSSWPIALGYTPWIEEVWMNYLSNAIKYGGQPPHIEVGVTSLADGLARFWVRDNGSGLSPEERSRLFTPFTRLNQVRAKGHGLGLSIVRRIIEKLGGEVGVESQPGHGSTFYFILPIAPRDN